MWPEAIEQTPAGATGGSGVQHAVEMQVTSCWAAAWVFGPSGIYILEQKSISNLKTLAPKKFFYHKQCKFSPNDAFKFLPTFRY